MNCSNCGAPLPPGASACPRCGTLTPSYFTNAAASPNEPTYASSIPSTEYGSQPYDPYSVTPPPPPPPPLMLPPQRRDNRNKVGIIVGGLLLLILVGAGVFAIVSHTGSTNQTAKASPTTQATTHTVITPTSSNTEPNPYPPDSGTLALNDPLSDNSKGYAWEEGQPYSGTTCAFTGGAYDVSITQQGIAPCTATSTDFSNFAFQVQMTLIKGAAGGIIFRINGPKYYYCYIHQDGSYGCSLYVDATSTPKVLVSGSSSAIKTGLKQSNLIAVVANSNNIKLYANGQLITSISDNSYSHGAIGLVAEDDSSPAEAVFSNAKVWTI
jgi:eukaryotic-like serine/threonine-protein kinase